MFPQDAIKNETLPTPGLPPLTSPEGSTMIQALPVVWDAVNCNETLFSLGFCGVQAWGLDFPLKKIWVYLKMVYL
jgi:hypothetical protein